MKKTKKHITLAIIAILIAALAFGYAYLTTTLSINGITDIDRNSWDVYFDNIQVTTGSVSGAQEIEAPTITSDTEVEFHVNLKKPGDFYEFTVEARNDGTIDAMISSISKKMNNAEITTLPTYLDYKVTYSNDIEIEDNHLLAAETLETYKIRVEYKKNVSATDLPSTNQSITLTFGVEYVQADDDATAVDRIVYSIDGATYGTKITEDQIVSIEDIRERYSNIEHFKIVTNQDIVKELYLGVYYNGQFHYLQGMGATYNESLETYNNDSVYYNTNKSILLNTYGSSNCTEINDTSFQCTDPYSLWVTTITKDGNVNTAGTNHSFCTINSRGYAFCGRA